MIQQIVRTALYEEIVKQLIQNIKNGNWAPEEQLPSEMEFAERFGVSRNCIREAIKVLAMSGIVQSRPGQGTFVSKEALINIANHELLSTLSNDSSLVEIIETRIIVESQLAGLAATRASDEDKERLSIAYDQLRGELAERLGHTMSKNPSQAGTDFHMAIVDAAKNKLLSYFLRSIKGELEAQRNSLVLRRNDVETMLEDHTRIYNAIIKGDPRAAEKAMERHLKNTYEVIISDKSAR